jgi:DNA-binding transcriptional MerR regulator/mannose-6-phosphate isomerase-like protein (cupin superfamily)
MKTAELPSGKKTGCLGGLAVRRQLYRVGEVAEMTGVSQATLRLWENYGLIETRRSSSGYRLYSSEDIKRITRVQQLRSEGINLAGIHTILAKEDGPDARQVSSDHPEELAENRFVGRHLRQFRLGTGLNITEVAKRSGLSASFISLVERGMSGVSVDSLEMICGALGADVRQFAGGGGRAPRRLVRAKERRALPTADEGIVNELLAEGDNLLDCQFFTVAPGRGSSGEYAHEGEEFIFLISGSFEIVIDQVERYTLKAGDSLYFKSTSPHKWKNIGKTAATGIWVNTARMR